MGNWSAEYWYSLLYTHPLQYFRNGGVVFDVEVFPPLIHQRLKGFPVVEGDEGPLAFLQDIDQFRALHEYQPTEQ